MAHRTAYLEAWKDKGNRSDTDLVATPTLPNSKTRPSRSRPYGSILSGSHALSSMASRKRFLDNLRLWDCLTLVRSDRNMTTGGATRFVFGLNDEEYLRTFGESGQIFENRFPSQATTYSDPTEEELEKIKLVEENARLHAVLWVLRDNPSLQVDSTLAALFRLDNAQFSSKFPYDGETGMLTRGYHNRRSDHRNNNKCGVRQLTGVNSGHHTPGMAIHLSSRPYGHKSRRHYTTKIRRHLGHKFGKPSRHAI